MEHWIVVINKAENIEEVRKAPEEKFSFNEAVSDLIAGPWTIGMNIARNHYHQSIIRSHLTRCLGARFEDLKDELSTTFKELVPPTDVEKAKGIQIPGRNEDYVDLNITFSVDIVKTALRISKVPVFLRPILGPILTTTPRSVRRGMKHLGPLFEQRKREMEAHGKDWADKPADMISWILDEAPEDERQSISELTKRMLVINFAAIHTSSNSFTHALYHLALEREKYVEPLREEIERVIKEEGWTKIAMTKMQKLDSFMKESQRFNGINILVLNRKVLVDSTLPDGTFLPKGTFVAANAGAAHHDEELYSNPEVFDGFRFADMRKGSVEESTKHQMVSTSADYLAFGHGRHACPGRFFAVNELKAMMAYLLLTYDVKLEHEGTKPLDVWMGTRLVPNPTAKVMFKKRAAC
ncbi:hypothetical protein EW145_g4362 [Phellinidium pouzarii]|uniref:Cytochrome P450 n=1 Tax=Phellinidium pouzarii TaxID=167371 RepID=A0A4S4L487_9AGAM|nr:hypothetical protein EW145_g4362 [Phellinidium pouzarii]